MRKAEPEKPQKRKTVSHKVESLCYATKPLGTLFASNFLEVQLIYLHKQQQDMFKAIALFCFIFTLSVVAQQEAAVPAPQALGCFVCDAGNTLCLLFCCGTLPRT